jgi:hypothetical protein
MIALPPNEAWNLLSPDPSAQLDVARVASQARTFFGVELAIEARDGDWNAHIAGRVIPIVTAPIEDAPLVLAAADEAVRAIGGAGMDALVARARRVWQVRAIDGVEPLVVSAVLASALLAPIVPPEGGSIFGVRGARERLEALRTRD